MGYRDNYFNANSSNHGWYRCVSCGKSFRKGDIDIDHILPQHHGGSDDLDNLQCATVPNKMIHVIPLKIMPLMQQAYDLEHMMR